MTALPKLVDLPAGVSKHDMDCAIAQQLFAQKLYETALSTVNMVLDEDPDHPWALTLAGRIALLLQKPGLGYNLLKRAMSINPKADIKRNYGAACLGVLRLDEAKRILQELRREKPSDEKALSLLATLAIYQCDPKLAIELGEKSLAMKSDQKDVHESLGYAHLLLGNFEKGWQGYEGFIGASKYRPDKPPHKGCIYWDGAEGLDLYVRGEQGLGDEISFASVLPEIIGRMRSITFDCDEKLGNLFARSFPGVEVHATRKAKTADKPWIAGREFDAWCLVGSLAKYHRNRAEDFPGKPYLVADPELRVQWRALLDTLPGKKVGIAWNGGSRGTFRDRRSLTLDDLLPVLRVPGVSWVSLEYKDPADDIEAFRERHGISIKHWPRATQTEDYDDTAALVSELDLVITVCTAGVHLSGALGKQCWVFVPNKPRWFYGMQGRTSPWYASVEYFRQEKEWPLHEMARRLAEFAHA